MARRSQHVAVAIAIEEAGAELLFEALDAPGDGGVAHAEGRAGGTYRTETGESEEVLQIVPVHGLGQFYSTSPALPWG